MLFRSDSDEMYDFVKKLETTRIIDTTSGWFSGQKSDVDSSHVYFKAFEIEGKEKPHILSEFGGFSYPIIEHCFSIHHQHGYGFCKDSKELTDRILEEYYAMVLPSIKNGLCGSVYTQIVDVEDEVNGLYTMEHK